MLKNCLFPATRLLVRRPVIIRLFNRTNKNVSLHKAFRLMEKRRIEQENKMETVVTNQIGDKLTPATINLIVVGNGGIGVPKSIYIMTNEDCYLIGCSETVSRLVNSLGVKPFKPKHIFITSNKWINTGGLVGLGMNLEVSGCNSMTVHGPTKLDELFYSSRYFGISAGIKLIYNPMNNQFKDCCFTINKFELSPSAGNEFKKRKIDDSAKVFNYHFKVNERTGRLDLNKCIELKVPVGPMLKKLKSGEDIKLPNGRLVKHSDVCAPSSPGDEFLIIDCPSTSYLNSLIENEQLNNLMNAKNSRLKYVFHYSDIDVVLDPKYQEWVNRFAAAVQHIGLNEFCANIAHVPTYNQLYHLNKFDPELFKPPHYTDKHRPLSIETRMRPANLLENFNLGMKKYTRLFQPVEVNFDKLDEELNEIKELEPIVQEYKTKTKDLTSKIKYPEVIFMGTASAAPGKYRNSSCVFISLNESESCILDCGEGSLYQLISHFGTEKYFEKLFQLKFIFISHLHADHHIGLINLLLEREKSFRQLNRNAEPLVIFMPDAVFNFLKLYDQNFEPIRHLYTAHLLPHKDKQIVPLELAEKIGLKSMYITRVPHCFQSCGVVFTTKTSEGKDYKIAYSGDTLPSESLPNIGQNADLLIHEATFSEFFEDEALKKRHTTSEQAIEVRNRMNAKFLILTHFSNRYAKAPYRSRKFDEQVGIAYDHLELHPDNLQKSALLIDILETLYKEEILQSQSVIDRKKSNQQLLNKYINEQSNQA